MNISPKRAIEYTIYTPMMLIWSIIDDDNSQGTLKIWICQ